MVTRYDLARPSFVLLNRFACGNRKLLYSNPNRISGLFSSVTLQQLGVALQHPFRGDVSYHTRRRRRRILALP